MNNCMQLSSVFTMTFSFMLRVSKVNADLRYVVAQQARAGAEGTKGKTGCG